MNELFVRIQDGIVEILPAAAGFQLQPETFLNEIPEWDSMTAVNFKIFLEEAFGVRIPDELLEGESSLRDVIEFIRRTD